MELSNFVIAASIVGAAYLLIRFALPGSIKSDPDLHPIPIVVLSSSGADEHVLRGYELHASCWVVKGADLEEARHRIRALFEFWTGTAQLPKAMSATKPAVS